MKTILVGFVALSMIGSMAAIAPTLDANDPHLQPLPPLLREAAAQERIAAQDAAARAAEAALREIYEQEDFEIMRGVVYEPQEIDRHDQLLPAPTVKTEPAASTGNR